MEERPTISKELDTNTFMSFYYLKEELVAFCKQYGIPVTGGKAAITKRIAYFLESGVILYDVADKRESSSVSVITEDTLIEKNIVCSEVHRAFFKEHIGKSFTFNVIFQKWLKENSGKTYREAIEAYARIKKEKSNSKTVIDKQFEYNTYIRDFYEDNKGKTLDEAIVCWKYKKTKSGHNRYERADLVALRL